MPSAVLQLVGVANQYDNKPQYLGFSAMRFIAEEQCCQKACQS